MIRKEKNGLLIKTKYGELLIPGKDIASVAVTISIKSFDNWDQSLDSLLNTLTEKKPQLEKDDHEETTEVTNSDKKEKNQPLDIKEKANMDMPTSNNASIAAEPPMTFIPYDEPPKRLAPIKPIYPQFAQEAGIEGTVYVQAFINSEGKVTHTKILKGIPRTGLDESSIDAVRNTHFQPAIYRGKPVGVWITIPITYKL
ncbi:MAG: TonB family protein, partial [Fidelibacterota bacterium]